MSSPGQQIDPSILQALQQYQQQQQKMQMAQALMGNNANPATPNAGIANLGGDLLGAMAQKRIQQQYQQQNNPNGINPVNVTPQQVGGGVQGWMGRNTPGLASLFNLGGGQ